MPLLVLSDLRARIGARTLFSVPAARVEAGDRVALLGPSGVGKSTLLRAIIDGADGVTLARGLRVGYLPQELPTGHESSGERTRAALASLLGDGPDLLVLDEPTNHLDLTALEWLEREIRRHSGTVLMVSHDRVFMDRVATAVWEMDHGGRVAEPATLRVFRGNFSTYRAQRELDGRTEQAAYAAYAARHDHLERAAQRRQQWAQKASASAGVRDPYAQKKAAKAAKRAGAADKRLQRLEEAAPDKPWIRDPVRLPVGGAPFSGRLLLKLGEREVGPRGRIAVVGPNGSGKTTLLRTLAGELPGDVWRSPAARIGFLRQERDDLPPDATPFGLLGGETAAALGLRGDRAHVPVRSLSGGERTAIALAGQLGGSHNILLLDEPTNHLDLWLREACEDALARFPGAVVLATHDRWLVQHWAEDVWRVVE